MFNKFFLLLIFFFVCLLSKAQILPGNLENHLLKYFITLPQNQNFSKWIESIKADPAIAIDSMKSKNENDTFYYYLAFKSNSFTSPLKCRHQMVIIARNNVPNRPKEAILLTVRIRYFLDTTEQSRRLVKKEYNNVSAKFKSFFDSNKEKVNYDKNDEAAKNAFFFHNTRFATFTIERGRYYLDHTYILALSLYYQLE